MADWLAHRRRRPRNEREWLKRVSGRTEEKRIWKHNNSRQHKTIDHQPEWVEVSRRTGRSSEMRWAVVIAIQSAKHGAFTTRRCVMCVGVNARSRRCYFLVLHSAADGVNVGTFTRPRACVYCKLQHAIYHPIHACKMICWRWLGAIETLFVRVHRKRNN